MLIVDEELRRQKKEMVNIDDNENRIRRKRKTIKNINFFGLNQCAGKPIKWIRSYNLCGQIWWDRRGKDIMERIQQKCYRKMRFKVREGI